MRLTDIQTPAVIIDMQVVERNLERAADVAEACSKKLRPHIKTHKIPSLALKQIEHGAVGICTAKVSEAEVMAEHGIGDILIANEIVGEAKLERVMALAGRIDLSVLVDSFETLLPLADMVAKHGVHIGVYVELETGDKRCGATEDVAVSLAKRIEASPGLSFLGIETFGGSIFHCSGAEMEKSRLDEVLKALVSCRGRMEAEGIHVEEISVGGSPAFNLLARCGQITELRPGVYVFNDAATVSRSGASFSDCALSVLTTVISISADKSYAVVDGGAKTFSYCCPGIVFGHRILHGVLKDQVDVCLSGLSEEHGIVDISSYRKRFELKVGDVLEVIPAHACPVVNLTDKVYLKSGEDYVLEPVLCRGLTE